MTPRVPIAGGRARTARDETARGAAIRGWPAPVSFALHALVFAVILWRPALWLAFPSPPPEDVGTVQIEYVNHFATQKGAPPSTDAQNAAKPAPAAQPSEPKPPPPPPDPSAALPEPPAAPQSPASAPQAAAPQASQPVVHLGNSDEDSEALSVTGDDVVSSGPDARYRNMPPDYPRAAARHHEQGTVEVLIHITPRGEPGEIEIVASSGSTSLDEATREAVMKWHFKPAIRDGVPVASIYPLRVRFRDERS
jgi:periplasmic protein TonB